MRFNNPAFGQETARTTNYDPAVLDGWHVRPNNWEGQVSIQREIVPRVSAYAAYTRRWFGNLTATRNRAVTNADFSPYCVPVPADSRLENGGGYQQCGLFDVNRNITPNNLIFNSSDIGGIDDVYDGFDFDVNARLARNIILSGGVSLGRERVSYCNLKDDLSLTTNGRDFGVNTPRTDDYCNITPPFQPQVKGQVAYPLPWWDISLSATFQSLSGPQLERELPIDQRACGAIARPAVHGRSADRQSAAQRHDVRRSHLPDRSPRQQGLPERRHGDSADGLDLQPVQCEPDSDLQPRPTALPGCRRRSSCRRGLSTLECK